MPTNIVDTNVLIVANRRADHVSEECVFAAQKLLNYLKENKAQISITKEIFEEYKNKNSLKGQPGLGDAFFNWLFYNSNPEWVDISGVSDDTLPANFDRGDYKFLKVALCTIHAPATIHNATDNDDWASILPYLEEQKIGFHQVCEVTERAAGRKM